MYCKNCNINDSKTIITNVPGKMCVVVTKITICNICKKELKKETEIIKGKQPKDPKSDKWW